MKWWRGLAAVVACSVAAPVVAAAKPGKAGDAAKLARDVAGLLQRLTKTAPGKDCDVLVDRLIEAGDEVWPSVRASLDAVQAGPAGEPAVVDLLLGFGLTSYDDLLARTPRLSDASLRRIAKALLSGHYPNDDKRLRAISAMSERNDEALLMQILPELITHNPSVGVARAAALLTDPRPALRAYATDVLVAVIHVPALPQLVEALRLEQQRASVSNVQLRAKLIHALARLARDTDAVVDPLIAAMALPDQREYALDGLALVGAPAVRAAIFLLKTADRARVEVALQILAHLRTQAAPELLPLVAAGDERSRALAMDLLAHLAVPAVREPLLTMVRQRQFRDLKSGLELAVAMYDPSVRQLLTDLLADVEPAVRRLALEQAARLRDPELLPALRKVAAHDTDRSLRLHAMAVVATSGEVKSMEFARRMVEVQDATERLAVIDLLARLDTVAALPALAHLMSDPNDEVFRRAQSALLRITGHAGPRREAEWLAWQAAEAARKPEPVEELKPVLRKYLAGGRDRAWLEVDDGDDATVVAVSGPPFRDASHLAPHVFRLANDRRVLVPLRQAGDGTGAATTLADRALDLDAVLAKAKAKKVVLLADASGGSFALAYAAARPDRVSHVVLHGGPWPSGAAVRAMREQMAEAMPEPWRPDAAWAAEQALAGLPLRVALRVLARSLAAAMVNNTELVRRLVIDNLFDDAFDPELAARAVAEAERFPPKVAQAKVLLLLGSAAPWAATTQVEVKQLPAEQGQKVKLVPIAGCRSLPLLENPAQALSAIVDFLD